MIVDPKIVEYMDSIEPGNSEIIEAIRTEAIDNFVPIIKRSTESFLKTMIAINNPKDILEVGTGVGYSAIIMSEVTTKDSHITTIEKYEPRFDIAKHNIEKSGNADKITFIGGDATDILEDMKSEGKKYDFIFMDAAKGQYIKWLPTVLLLLNVGGILLSDNVLQEGTIQDSRFVVDRRDRTIHARMRNYLYTLKHTEDLMASIVPIGDGMAICVKMK